MSDFDWEGKSFPRLYTTKYLLTVACVTSIPTHPETITMKEGLWRMQKNTYILSLLNRTWCKSESTMGGTRGMTTMAGDLLAIISSLPMTLSNGGLPKSQSSFILINCSEKSWRRRRNEIESCGGWGNFTKMHCTLRKSRIVWTKGLLERAKKYQSFTRTLSLISC